MKDDEKKLKTITEADVKESGHITRRSVFKLVAGTVAGSAAVLAGAQAIASKSESIRNCTDADSGPNADPGGNGRGTGQSDSDSGPNEDPPGCAGGRARRR